MKKLLTITMLVAVMLMVLGTSVKATTNAELIEYLTSNHTVSGESIGLTSANRVKVERYLTQNPLTDEEATAIMAKGNSLIAIMEEAGVSDPADLSEEDKTTFMSIAQEAASIADLTLVFTADSVEVYKDGELIDTGSLGTAKLSYTGNSVNIALVVSLTAILALATGVVAKKRLVNA